MCGVLSACRLCTTLTGICFKSALIFMSNDAAGLVVQKQLPEHAEALNLDLPFSQSYQMGSRIRRLRWRQRYSSSPI